MRTPRSVLDCASPLALWTEVTERRAPALAMDPGERQVVSAQINARMFSQLVHPILGMRRVVLIGLACLMAMAWTAQGAGKTEVRLLLDKEKAVAGDTVLAGVQLRMPPRWHTYWRNPGDSGDRTKIEWQLPPGITAGEIQWPVPEKLTAAGFTTYVYHDRVLLLVPLQIDRTAPAGPLEIKANVSWLECDELCIPGKGSVQARLTIAPESKPSSDASLIEGWSKKIPRQNPALTPRAAWEKTPQDNSRPLIVEWTAGAEGKEADFFPYASDSYGFKGETDLLSTSGGKVRLD